MLTSNPPILNIKIARIILILSLAIAIYWIIGTTVNVYHFAITGAIYEILWLPAMVMIFALPITALIFWIKEKFSLKSLHIYSILITVATLLFAIFFNHQGVK